MESPYVRIAQLFNRKKVLEDELNEVKKEISEVDLKVQERFLEDGVTSVRVEREGRSIRLHRQLWAKVLADKSDVADALQECGLGALVSNTFNTNQLSSHLRELVKEEEPDNLEDVIPPQLVGKVGISEVFQIKSTTLSAK